MENIRPISYTQIIERDWRKGFVVVLIVVLFSLIATLIMPFKFGSSVSILVNQKSGFSIDAYSASKSEERVANKLAQVVYTSSFLDKVLQYDTEIDRNYFSSDERERRKDWKSTIDADVPVGLGQLNLTIYHTDPAQAYLISDAAAKVLIRDRSEFIGIGDVELKILEYPLVSKYPLKPNIFLNFGLSIVVGIILAFAYIVLTYNPERDKLFKISGGDEEEIEKKLRKLPEFKDEGKVTKME